MMVLLMTIFVLLMTIFQSRELWVMRTSAPPIYYSNALKRHLIWIWRLRLIWPREDIFQYVDDIQAAFHRILYHPNAGIIFATVFAEFLIIPIGTIFGARNSPSIFTLLSALQAHVASYTAYCSDDLTTSLTDLTQ